MESFDVKSYKLSTIAIAISCAIAAHSVSAQDSESEAPKEFPSPNAIVDGADDSEWIKIDASDLLIMDLEKGRDGKDRRVIIQLMPKPFSQGWVRNIRKLTAAKFWDDTAIVRVQDNYVTQWGDPNAGEESAKPLPEDLEVIGEKDYIVEGNELSDATKDIKWQNDKIANISQRNTRSSRAPKGWHEKDSYSEWVEFVRGWPIANIGEEDPIFWPVHCYAMVGVGRGFSPNTGDGSSLYTVIGHAPRHLDRNIALIGRIISGIEHMSSLPRGTGILGFYETPEERTKIVSVRLGNEVSDAPNFEYLNTHGLTFARYIDARANRRDPFFNIPAGGTDICNIPVPIRQKK